MANSQLRSNQAKDTKLGIFLDLDSFIIREASFTPIRKKVFDLDLRLSPAYTYTKLLISREPTL